MMFKSVYNLGKVLSKAAQKSIYCGKEKPICGLEFGPDMCEVYFALTPFEQICNDVDVTCFDD